MSDSSTSPVVSAGERHLVKSPVHPRLSGGAERPGHAANVFITHQLTLLYK